MKAAGSEFGKRENTAMGSVRGECAVYDVWRGQGDVLHPWLAFFYLGKKTDIARIVYIRYSM